MCTWLMLLSECSDMKPVVQFYIGKTLTVQKKDFLCNDFFCHSGQPYAGASAQRMGSASLRKYSPTHNIRGNGTIANKSVSQAC